MIVVALSAPGCFVYVYTACWQASVYEEWPHGFGMCFFRLLLLTFAGFYVSQCVQAWVDPIPAKPHAAGLLIKARSEIASSLGLEVLHVYTLLLKPSV